VPDDAADEDAERHRPTKAHDPQCHHPAADRIRDVLLQHRGQGRDDDEVGVPDEEREHERHDG